jgi:hypothetical protein
MGAGMGTNLLWFIIWLLILIFISFEVAGFCAFFYILILPITVCIPDISVGKKFPTYSSLPLQLTYSLVCGLSSTQASPLVSLSKAPPPPTPPLPAVLPKCAKLDHCTFILLCSITCGLQKCL